MSEDARLRIGELSRRVGVSPELLRAWETRYGLVHPERTAGGLRLFSEDDERRVLLMRQNIAAGLSASEAARLAKRHDGQGAPDEATSLAEIENALEHALDTLDEPTAQVALDRLFRHSELQAALAEVVLPFLYRLGERWATGARSVADEHFASNVIGGRLRALTRDWGKGVGPRAILACPPGEQHDLGLLCFGLALREHGWRIIYLGAETPLGDINEAVGEHAPAIVVLAAVNPQPFLDVSKEILTLRSRVRVAIGGRGGTTALADRLGVEILGGDAIPEAARLAP
jgi:MerR family transcriptional regulator, light-induced transcriptional regulator